MRVTITSRIHAERPGRGHTGRVPADAVAMLTRPGRPHSARTRVALVAFAGFAVAMLSGTGILVSARPPSAARPRPAAPALQARGRGPRNLFLFRPASAIGGCPRPSAASPCAARAIPLPPIPLASLIPASPAGVFGRMRDRSAVKEEEHNDDG